ncbi:DsbA family oxidoreductase [Bacillus testis]|uniref:DsbA family oxidoreductase n=1 Tax=Bacillus testis TaxID=1622072 RepID=UPI00067EE8F0|nr:DsbA family protein [Bacillus testis]
MANRLVVFFDYNCPFCYLESLRLQELENRGITLEWRSYQKPENASPPAKPSDYGEQVKRYLKQVREEKGLAIFPPSKKGSTVLAHTGGKYAAAEGKYSTYQQLVFEAIWRLGETVEKADQLADIAFQAGMNRGEFKAALDNPLYREAAQADFDEAERKRIWTIPYYIGDKGYLDIYHFNEIPSLSTIAGLF